MGIGIDGTKHPLALVDGSTENATLVTDLLVGLRDRGLDVTRPILVVIDGAKALAAAARAVFDHPILARCQLHKIRNVQSSALEARAALEQLARQLERSHPGAAGSLREGLEETLTVLRLGVAPTLARTLRSTNPIESMIEICRDHSANVKNWRDGQMAPRWCAAEMVEAAKQFRRVNGFLHLPALRRALEAEVAKSAVTQYFSDQKRAALSLAEAVTLIADRRVPDDVYAEASQQLSDAQVYCRVLARCRHERLEPHRDHEPVPGRASIIVASVTLHGRSRGHRRLARRRSRRLVVGDDEHSAGLVQCGQEAASGMVYQHTRWSSAATGGRQWTSTSKR